MAPGWGGPGSQWQYRWLRTATSADSGSQTYEYSGRAALERKPTKQVHSFEFKLALVRQFLDGEGIQPDLARMRQLSSPKLLGKWVQIYREQGEDGLRPKAKGRPKPVPGTAGSEVSELERLRQENQRLAVENEYLKKYEP